MVKDEKPVFGTREWANHNVNCIAGCSHECLYCFAESDSVRYKRKTSDSWRNESVNRRKLEKGFRKRQGRFMFPTTHDITPEHLDECMLFLKNILKPGNEVLVVTKPHMECIKSICDRFSEYRRQILFRFTIGSTDNDTLSFWEPHAPSFGERLESLMYAFSSGYATSVSAEPMLDNNADDLIQQVRPYLTDAIWLGKGNRMISRLRANGHGDPETLRRAVHLMASLSAEYVLDLYGRYRDDPRIKWKDSLKKVVGIEISVKAGLDI
ncbi:MAG: hypothetical protein ACOYOS_10415 [Syntrophales bacterium]